MKPVAPDRMTRKQRALFNEDEPAGLRLTGVLDGILPGKISVDDLQQPKRAYARESTYGTIYLAGEWENVGVHTLIDDLRQGGEVMIGLWPGDPRAALLPLPTDYEGTVYDFSDHPPGAALERFTSAVPDGFRLRRVDLELFERLTDRDEILAQFYSSERALDLCVGFCLLDGDEIVCETFTSPAIRGVMEIGVTTKASHRGRGYARLTCSRLIQECDRLGYQTFWNCNAQNLPSVALARRLGYRRQRDYHLWYWAKTT